MKKRLLKALAGVLAAAIVLGAMPISMAGAAEPFTDVNAGAWYAPFVQYVYEHSIMKGISDTQFAPTDVCTRGMIAAVVYRIAGSPPVSGETSFTDLRAEWYKASILWAQKTGVVYGESATRFNPDGSITREQLAAMLWRYVGEPNADAKLADAFTDAAEISTYAKQAMNWAIEKEIICGNQNRLSPKKQCNTGGACKGTYSFYTND